MIFQFELLVLFDVEEPQWALSEDVVADCKEIFTLFDTDNVNLLINLNLQTVSKIAPSFMHIKGVVSLRN